MNRNLAIGRPGRRSVMLGLCALALAGCDVVRARRDTTLIVLRHADRAGLSDALDSGGRRRAAELPGALEGVGLDLILSPDLQRNRDTVGPLARARGLAITLIDPSRTGFAPRVLALAEGRSALFVGNKDNLTPLYRELGITAAPPDGYGDLHIIRLRAGRRPEVEILHYGR